MHVKGTCPAVCSQIKSSLDCSAAGIAHEIGHSAHRIPHFVSISSSQYSWQCAKRDHWQGLQTDVACHVQALKDFQDRIAKYEEVYETITDRSLHYIKLIDM